MINDILSLHENIASDVWPNGARLVCKDCDEIIIITSEECAEYLAKGWPKHHNKTMILETLDEEN